MSQNCCSLISRKKKKEYPYGFIHRIQTKELLFKRPIKFLIYVPLTIFGFGFHTKSRTTKSNSDNFGKNEYSYFESQWKGYYGIPFGLLGLIEAFKWWKISLTLPIKDPVSFYDIMPLVELYNKQLMLLYNE